MAKQSELKGLERPKIQELEDKGEVYSKSMNRRVKAGVAEKADKAALIEALRKHKLKSYRMDDGTVITLADGSPKVQLSEAEEPEPDDDEEDPKASKKEEAN